MKTIICILLLANQMFSDPGVMVEIDVFVEQITQDNGIKIDGEQIG